MKDINALVTLIRAGLIDAGELSRQVFLLDGEPAWIAEATRVMDEIEARADTRPGSAGAGD